MHKIVYNKIGMGIRFSDQATEWLNEQLKKVTSTQVTMGKISRKRSEILCIDTIPELLKHRHHSLLAECVEKFGAAANGVKTELAIEIIYDNKYLIHRENGVEVVRTTSNTSNPNNTLWVCLNPADENTPDEIHRIANTGWGDLNPFKWGWGSNE